MTTLRLNRPLVIFDVETTGVHPQVDRVVQIGLIKLYPDGHETEWQSLVNPGMPIPPEATRIHGISDDDVADQPTFNLLAPKIANGFKDCDVGGFNVRFDVIFLKKEFDRVGAKSVFTDAKIVDAFRIYRQFKPRTLVHAVKEYLGEDLPDAHDALADAKVTVRVLKAQLVEHKLPDNVDELYTIFFETPADGFLDPDGKIAWRYGQATINFGKWAATSLDKVDKGYLRWMLDGDFTPEVKHIIREAMAGRFPRS